MQIRKTLGLLILVMAFGLSAAYAADVEIAVNQGPVMQISGAALENLKPVVNRLPPPDTSKAVLETGIKQYPAGVMTKAGIIGEDEDASSRAYGSFGIPYTTARVQDGSTTAVGVSTASRLSTTYPYRTVGKLTFSAGYCSASVIRRGIIVTAAHCIQSFGSGGSIYSGWKFYPGYYGPTGSTAAQQAPYGIWNWLVLTRPTTWANGTDPGSGSCRNNDLAVIVLAKNGTQMVGDRTGYLGYGWNNYSFVNSTKTGSLWTAAVSTLGYPALMDGGKIMQRTDGPSYLVTLNGAGQIRQGSNFTGGSSGGPWVVNFRSASAALSGGATIGSASTMAVVGVTSWGTSDPNLPKDNYSSQFRQNTQFPNAAYGTWGAGNIGALVNAVCSYKLSGHTTTLAQEGYCN